MSVPTSIAKSLLLFAAFKVATWLINLHRCQLTGYSAHEGPSELDD